MPSLAERPLDPVFVEHVDRIYEIIRVPGYVINPEGERVKVHIYRDRQEIHISGLAPADEVGRLIANAFGFTSFVWRLCPVAGAVKAGERLGV